MSDKLIISYTMYDICIDIWIHLGNFRNLHMQYNTFSTKAKVFLSSEARRFIDISLATSVFLRETLVIPVLQDHVTNMVLQYGYQEVVPPVLPFGLRTELIHLLAQFQHGNH